MADARVLLVDGTGLCYRAHFAIAGLSTRQGQPTNAVFGFIRTLRQLARLWHPTHWAVVLDGGVPAARLAVLPTYKAQRPPMPSDLRKQMPLVEEYLERARIPALRLEGEEADDLLATLARKAAGEGADVTIVTSDKDLLQIAGGTVWIVAPSKTATRVGREDVMAKLGVYPEQVVDWLALTGDSTDNVPGVPGVGPRTAARLLQDFGSLAEVWPRLDEVQPEKLRLALRQHRQRVEANQALLSLRHDLPCELDWAAMALAPEDAERVLPFYERLELRSLADEAREGRLL